MMRNYSVKIVKYDASQGSIVAVSLSAEARKHFQGGLYWRLWAKGRRLYFLPANATTGNMISGSGEIHFTADKYGHDLDLFFGEYNELHYDETTHYEYVHLDDRSFSEVKNGLRKGEKYKSSSKASSEPPSEEKQESDEPKQETPPVRNREPDDFDSIIDSIIVEYVMNNECDKAVIAAEIKKKIGERRK